MKLYTADVIKEQVYKLLCKDCEETDVCPVCGANLEVAAAQADKMEEVKNSDTMKKLPFAIVAGILCKIY